MKLLLWLTVLMSHVRLAHAAGAGEQVAIPNPISETIPGLISRTFTALVYIAAYLAPLFIIWGAFQMLTSAGDAEKFNQGKKTMLYTIIGFLIVLGAKGIVNIVGGALGIE